MTEALRTMVALTDAPRGSHRWKLAQFLEREAVRNAILMVIVINAVTLGLSTSDTISAAIGPLLGLVDSIVIGIFVAEISLKLYAFGFSFFRSAWNVFDFVVVLISIAPRTEGLSALRGLRVIRALRILSVVPQMRSVVQALFDAMPGMGAVVIMLGIIYYVFAVMATMLYGDTHPQWFGTIADSLYSLFQIMTLESWSMGIVRPVMEQHPYAWLFFVPFIVTTAFAVLNLFIGLLVNTMQSAVEEETEREIDRMRQVLQVENAELSAQIRKLSDEVHALRVGLHREGRQGAAAGETGIAGGAGEED